MRRRKASSKLSLDKVPVSAPRARRKGQVADNAQPSQSEAAHLHELMLSVNDKKVDKIDGETVVPMHDTEVRSATPFTFTVPSGQPKQELG